MSKKRNCRYTPEEALIHEQAVRLRKMTDKQLVEAFNADSDARAKDNARKAERDTSKVQKLLSGLANGECNGVRKKTAKNIEDFARERGLIV